MAMYPGTIDQLESGYTGIDQWDCIYLGDEKIWPNYPDISEVVNEIYTRTGYRPIHFAKFDGNYNQTTVNGYSPYSFVNFSSQGSYTTGVGGRQALECLSTDITLAAQAKGSKDVFVSCLIRPTSFTTYNGFIGGTIFGLNTQGFGYACGWASSIQSNKICAECYAGGSAAAAYSPTSASRLKWHHVMMQFHTYTLTGGSNPEAQIAVNSSSFTTATGYGSLGGLDYSNLSDGYIHLGCVWQSGKNYFRGQIQDFILYDQYIDTSETNLLANYYKELKVY